MTLKKPRYSPVVQKHVELMGEINIKLRIMKLFFQNEGLNELAEQVDDEIAHLNKIFDLAVMMLKLKYKIEEE